MANEGDILIKLIIQGQSPQELHRLAEATQGQLNEEMAKKINELTLLHMAANQKITDDDKKQIDARIKAATKALDAVNQIRVANKEAAEQGTQAVVKAHKEQQAAFAKTLSMAADGVIAFKGFWGAVSGGLSQAKNVADEIDKLTNVYGSLKGSIDEMREASRGEISDFDLITTKTRALEKDLQLTDQQFGAVAAAADNFADALGTDTKHALDQIVDGLATGRVKMLEHAGVVINVEEAYTKYAKSIGVAADQLSEHGKKIAVVRESLRAMDKKIAESGASVDNFSHNYEKMVAEFKNNTDQLLLYLGDVANKIFEVFTTTLPRAIRHGLASVQDSLASNGPLGEAIRSIPGIGPLLGVGLAGDGSTHHLADEKAFDAIEDRNREAARTKAATDAAARLAAGTSYNYQQGSVADSIDKKKAAAAAKALDNERARMEKFNNQFQKMLRGDKDAGTPGLDVVQLDETQRSHDLDTAFDATGSRRAAPGGLSGGLARQAALQRAFAGKGERDSEDVDRQEAQAAEAMAKLNEDTLTEMLDKADKLRERAGNGIFATILFGPSGREQLLDDIDVFKENAADAMGIVADAGMKMAEALGASLSAFISGDKNKRKSIRDTTHDILEALAAQAYTRAIFETAEGLASLALGPLGGASATAHFAAAGMFAAVGTAAGLGARAIGQSSGSTTGAGAGKGAGAGSGASGGGSGVSSSGNGFGSGGRRSSGGGDGSQNITIVVNSQFTTQAEVGRAINLALAESYARDGRGVPVSMGSV